MKTAYPLFPVSAILILAYFFTWMFYRWGIFSLQTHRKFWNYLLLTAFLVSGLLGILSVIKVNYKLEIPKYDTYLKWHVVFGIALVFIAFFHLSWHLKYYFGVQKRKAKKPEEIPPKTEETALDKFRHLLFLLGFLAVINQVVFIREFISVLSGNELVLGIVMAGWMLLTGWGAFYGRKKDFAAFSLRRGISMLIAFSVLPLILIGLLYWLKNQLFPPGTIVNIELSVFAVFLLLFPVCFLSGFLFTAFSTLYSHSKSRNLTGKAYAFESLGSLFGGLFFTLLLGRFFNSFQIFGLSATVVFFAAIWILKPLKKLEKLKFILPGILLPTFIFIVNPDNFIKKMLFPNQEIMANKSTRYGNLLVTKQAGQYNVYENNDLQFYTENRMATEEAVHFAMVQHKNPKQVLLISGGMSGMIEEIQKYKVDKITYLESNPEIFSALKKYSQNEFNSGNVEIIKSDIRTFIGRSNQKYDVILLNLPAPNSLGLNRFYTAEFFRLLKKHCTKESVICTSLPSTLNYAEENALETNSSLWKTVGDGFKNRIVFTGEKNYFLASDETLSENISGMISEKGIENEYVNKYYINDELIAQRSQTLIGQFSETSPVNHDFSPYIFIRQISHWMSYFGTDYKILMLLPVLLFFLGFIKTDRITVGLYTGGFTAASLEIVLILAYQIYFGSIYLATALFFAVFMAGLASGSSKNLKINIPLINQYYQLQFLLAGFAIVLPFIISIIGSIQGWQMPVQFLFFVIIFILAFGIGLEFQIASKLQSASFSETAGINYSTDLAGSAFGALFTAILLLPFLGLITTCFLVAALNLFSGSLAFSARKTGIF